MPPPGPGDPRLSGISSPDQTPPELVAAPWHTVTVLLLLVGIGALSAWSASRLPAGTTGGYFRIQSYALVFVWEWLTVAFIAWGVRRRGSGLSSLVGGSWPQASAIFRDLAVAMIFLFGSSVILGALQLAMRATPKAVVREILPQTPLETVLWILLSATAGFCEETIFRGYLQRQLSVFSGNLNAGLVLQGVVFGLCHGYQGVKSAVTIGVYGCLFGMLARWRQSLRPGMMAHFLQDGVGGLVMREILKRYPLG